MSAFCDIALALGLSFGGTCVSAEPPRAGLPEDDPAAWEIPAPPPPPEPAPPPPMPPIIIKKEAPRPPEPEPAPAPLPPVTEAPRPLQAALEAAWSRPGGRGPGWDREVYNAQEAELLSASLRPAAPALTAPDPLDLKGLAQSDYEGARRLSTRPVDNQRIVTADRYITGILETGINSQVGSGAAGAVIIQTARDVFGYHGRTVLIPKGSRLVCEYAPPEDIGSSRLTLSCQRILMAGHRAEIRELHSAVGDVQGRQGVSGEVDRRFWERYGTAFLLTGISTGVRFASASTKSDDQDGTAATSAAEKAAEELSARFGEISASVLEQTLSLTPILTIPQGTRVQIRPAVDWYIAKAE